ncbi:EamA family transporter [Nocardioides sp. Bht2]|uniref:EamA family transporter n=1 Tax=Nocardioides sp. Bht2 TaxID=3392297 RepID=UPI0039B69DFC
MRRAVIFVMIGIASVQLGATIAKHLFDRAEPATLVLFRLATSAVLLGIVVRPSLRGRSRADWWVVFGYATSLAVMNWSIYQSFARIPLGLAVTIEFVGPLSVALLASRRARDLLWVGLAAAGVVLLGFDSSGINLAGVGFALLAGAAWAAYILLSAGTGRRWPGLDGLTVASIIATVWLLPIALPSGDPALVDPQIIAVGVAVGLLSSVIPYSLELAALRTLAPATFGILMSLEPAAAALAALVVLDEQLTGLQWLALACIVAASIGVTAAASRGFTQSSSGVDAAVVPEP